MTLWLGKNQDVAFRSLGEALLIGVLGDVVQVEANEASSLAQRSKAWAVASRAQFPFGVVAYATIFYQAVVDEVARADFCTKASNGRSYVCLGYILPRF